MNFDKIIPMLTGVAPSLAATLGGPMAGMAVTALESIFGLDAGTAKKDPAALTEAVLGMSPDKAAEVRAADQDFAEKMKQLDIDVIALAAKDRDSARNMQIQTKDPTPRLIACAVFLGYFSLLGLMAFRPLPDANAAILQILIGALSAGVGAILQFYFGSSAGSQAKDATIRDLSK